MISAWSLDQRPLWTFRYAFFNLVRKWLLPLHPSGYKKSGVAYTKPIHSVCIQYEHLTRDSLQVTLSHITTFNITCSHTHSLRRSRGQRTGLTETSSHFKKIVILTFHILRNDSLGLCLTQIVLTWQSMWQLHLVFIQPLRSVKQLKIPRSPFPTDLPKHSNIL